MDRLFNRATYKTLKTEVRLQLDGVGGGDSFQHCTRVNKTALCNAANAHHEQHLPVDVAIDLDKAAGDPRILRVMAKALGYELVPANNGTGSQSDEGLDLDAEVKDALKNLGSFTEKFDQYMADGVLWPHERLSLAKQCYQISTNWSRRGDALIRSLEEPQSPQPESVVPLRKGKQAEAG